MIGRERKLEDRVSGRPKKHLIKKMLKEESRLIVEKPLTFDELEDLYAKIYEPKPIIVETKDGEKVEVGITPYWLDRERIPPEKNKRYKQMEVYYEDELVAKFDSIAECGAWLQRQGTFGLGFSRMRVLIGQAMANNKRLFGYKFVEIPKIPH